MARFVLGIIIMALFYYAISELLKYKNLRKLNDKKEEVRIQKREFEMQQQIKREEDELATLKAKSTEDESTTKKAGEMEKNE